jgi:hypothetical protein
MAQPDNVSSDISHDVDLKGDAAEPIYGRGATFYYGGVREPLKYDRGQVESIFNTLLEEAIQHRMNFEGIWQMNFLQYHGMTDDSELSEWQSQAHVPLTSQAVDTAAAKITSVMFGQEEWVDPPEGDGVRYDLAKELVQWQLEKAEAQDPINQSVKDALICGNGPMKIHVETYAEPSSRVQWRKNPPRQIFGVPIGMGGKWDIVDSLEVGKRMRFEPVMPTDFWLDPSGQNRFYIQRIKVLPSDVWAKAKPLYGPDGKTIIRPAVYDPDVAGRVSAGMRDGRLDDLAANIRKDSPTRRTVQDRTVDLYEFWGDMIDPTNGAVVYRNILATFVNKQWCLRPPETNPFLHKRRPYIYFRGKLLPHQLYGYGILGHTGKLQSELDRLLRTFIDKTHLSLPIPVLDLKNISNASEIMGSHMRLAPGKALHRKHSASASQNPVAEIVKFSEPVNEWEIQLYNIIRGEFNAASGIDEFVNPAQATNVRKTRFEVQTKTQATQALFNDAAQYIEQTALSPMVDMLYMLMAQFEDQYDSSELMEKFSDNPEARDFLQQLSTMTPAERWRLMRLSGHFKVTGVTVQVTRDRLLSRIQQFFEMIQADPTYGQVLNKVEVMKIFLRIFDLPRIILLPDWESQMTQALQEAMVQQAQAQQAQQQGGQQAQQTMMGNNQNNQQAALGARGRAAAQGQREGGAVQ